ncbi:hypothetical protein BC938DRAFT_472298, partial [Jimgerdemannia flammicorona]
LPSVNQLFVFIVEKQLSFYETPLFRFLTRPDIACTASSVTADNLFKHYQQELPDSKLQLTYGILDRDLRLAINSNYFSENTTCALRHIKDSWRVSETSISIARDSASRLRGVACIALIGGKLGDFRSLGFGSLGTADHSDLNFSTRIVFVCETGLLKQSSVTKYQKGVAAVVDAEVNKWVEEAAKGDVEDVTTKRPHEFSESDDEQALSRKVQRKDVQIEDSEEEDRMYAEAAEVAAEKLRGLSY